jgi:hypothetical protein
MAIAGLVAAQAFTGPLSIPRTRFLSNFLSTSNAQLKGVAVVYKIIEPFPAKALRPPFKSESAFPEGRSGLTVRGWKKYYIPP